MHILVSIDDTDNIDSKGIKGTGEMAGAIAQTIKKEGWGKPKWITRHQLLLHEDIPYTSHNSAMCFEAEIEEQYLPSLIAYSSKHLQEESEPGSDPGLCVAILDHIGDRKKLIEFGYKAKKIVLTKDDAYELAKELNIHLSEHGGTGQGVIGALAGAGLRLGGNDGRFRGKHKLDTTDSTISVSDLCMQTKVDCVKTLEGVALKEDDILEVGNMIKSVLWNNQFVILVQPLEAGREVLWKTCSKNQLSDFEERRDQSYAL